MKWMSQFTVIAAVLGAAQGSQAGLLDHFARHQKATGCNCVPAICCRPTIVRPCHRDVHTYQRQLSCQKPMCCDTCCAPALGCGPICSVPTVDHGACAVPHCDVPCAVECCPVPSCGDVCALAELIHRSQTACYPRQRKAAIHKLGDRYQCACTPELMHALIFALNDSDPYVRRKAADEIGDQLRKNPGCCCGSVVSALTCALADCDKGTRREAEKALTLCGYDVVDACNAGCCEAACCLHQGPGTQPEMFLEGPAEPQSVPHEEAPAPPEVSPQGTSPASYLPPSLDAPLVPPAGPSVHFRTKQEFLESTARPSKGRTGLAGLFGLAK